MHNRFSEHNQGDGLLFVHYRLCWLKQGEVEGWVRWIEFGDRVLEPQCANGVHWKNLTLNCPTLSEFIS